MPTATRNVADTIRLRRLWRKGLVRGSGGLTAVLAEQLPDRASNVAVPGRRWQTRDGGEHTMAQIAELGGAAGRRSVRVLDEVDAR
jgi:hypothetical protein